MVWTNIGHNSLLLDESSYIFNSCTNIFSKKFAEIKKSTTFAPELIEEFF